MRVVSLVDLTLASGVRKYTDFETLAFPDYYGKLLAPVTLTAALPDSYFGGPGANSAQIRLSNLPVRGDTPGLTLSEIRLVDELYRCPVKVRHADADTGVVLKEWGGVVTGVDALTATEASLTAASYDDALLATPLPRRKLLDLFPDAATSETDRSVIWPFGVMRRATLTQLWARPLLVTFILSGVGPYSMHVQLAAIPPYTIASGDIFTVDMFMANSDFHASVDFLTTTSTGLTTHNVLDQNGISISTASSLAAYAVGKVYRRRFVVPPALVGQTINRLSVRINHSIAGTYQLYIPKAQMLDGGGTVRAVLYDEYSAPAAPVTLASTPVTNSVTGAPYPVWDWGGIRHPPTGTLTCVAVYRESVQLLPSEYSLTAVTGIGSLHLVRFSQSQADVSGALPTIQADFVSTEYADNPARVVESLLADATDGLGEPIAPASFTSAAADYVTTAITCAGGLDRQTKAGDILGGLLFHGALLERDSTAAWTLDVDTAAKRTTSSLVFGDGDPAQLDNCTVVSAPPPKLAERIKTLFLDGLRDPGLSEETMLVHTVRRRTVPGVEQTISVPYIGSLDSLDREADYLMKRMVQAEQQMQLDVSAIADGAALTLTRRQRTTLTAPGYFFSALPVAVRALTADGPTRHAVLEADDSTLHTYTPGTEQRADPRAAGIADPSFTIPAVVLNLRVLSSTLSVASDGSKTALTTVAATAPASNVSHVVFQVHTAGSTDILAERSISADPSEDVRAVFPLQPNVLYDLVAFARNVDNTAAAQDGIPDAILNYRALTDTTPPTVPGTLTARVNGRSITLDWADNTELDFSEYQIFGLTGAAGVTGLPNLLDNGGFESGLTSWVPLGLGVGDSATVVTGNPQSGYAYARLICVSGPASMGITQVVSGLTGGGTYTISGWLSVASYTAGRVHLDVTGTGITTNDILITSALADWTFYTETFTLPVGTTSVTVRFFADLAPVLTAYLDGAVLHAGGVPTLGKIAEARTSRFTLSVTTIRACYYYAVTAVDRFENISSRTAPIAILTAPVPNEETNPTPPLALTALTVALQGTTQTYQASDGATLAYATLTWTNPADTKRAYTNCLYRQTGTLTWLIGDQTLAAVTSSRIDDLRPLKSYDFAVQPFSQFGVGGPLTTVFAQIAPAESTPPAIPSGLTAVAHGIRTVQLDWIDNVEPDLGEYAVYQQGFPTLVDNGGFEAGLDTWVLFGTPGAGESVVSTRTSNPVNGSQALRVIGAGGAGVGQQQTVSGLTSGGTYTVGGWMLLTGWTAGGQAAIDVLGTGINTSGISLSANTAGWQYGVETFTLPVGTTSIAVRAFITNSATGTAYFDSLFLHAGTPNPTTKISEVRASRFVAANVITGLIYYFSVAAIDQLENLSAKCAPVGIVAEPVTSGDVNSAPPLALTGLVVTLQGTTQTYQAADGSTLAYATLTWGVPTDTRRAFTNVLYRQNGTATWLIADQTLATATSSRIDDLRPLSRYDFAVQPYSQFGVGGPLITVLNQIAPAESTAPAIPSGLIAVAPGLRSIQLDWIDNVEPDLGEYSVYQQSFPNVLDNGGFEEGLDGWATFGAPGAGESMTAIRLTNPVNGSQCLRIIGAGGAGLGQQQTGLAVTAGATYTVGGWMQLAGWTAGVAILDVTGTGLDTGGIILNATTTGWQFVRETFTVPIGTTSVNVRAFVNSATGAAYFDSLFLHAGTPNPTVKISEVRASRFLASNIVTGTIYYYSVAAIDQLENLSAKCTPVAVVSAPVTSGDVNPSAPLALTTLTSPSDGTYQSSDGTTWAYATLSWVNPTDTRRAVINVMFRKVGAGTWHVADQTTGTTGRVDDLSPGQSYDFGVQPLSQFGVGGAVTTLLNQVAPGDGIAPAAVTGMALVGAPPRGIRARWTANTEDDFAHYEVQSDTVNTFNSGNLITRRIKASEIVLGGLTNGQTYFVRARALDFTGNPGGYSAAPSLLVPRNATDDYGDDSLTSPKRMQMSTQSGSIGPITSAQHTHPENVNATYVSGVNTGLNTGVPFSVQGLLFTHSLGRIASAVTYPSGANFVVTVGAATTTTVTALGANNLTSAQTFTAVVSYW